MVSSEIRAKNEITRKHNLDSYNIKAYICEFCGTKKDVKMNHNCKIGEKYGYDYLCGKCKERLVREDFAA